MSRFPQAIWRGPVPNQGGTMGPIHGLVLHIQEGSEAGTDSWFHNPASKVSAHFGNPKSGRLDQWVEVGRVAWAEVSGNTNWISIETEGKSGDSLTVSQLENAAQLLAWLHANYGVPLQISDSTRPGLTGHGLGGSAWGGHTDCPGVPILNQRPAIIARATAILGGTSAPIPGDDVTPQDIAAIAAAVYNYGREDIPVPGGVIHNAPLGQLAHGAWVAVNDPKGPLLTGLAAIKADLDAQKGGASVDVAALAAQIVAAIESHLTTGADAQAVAAAVQDRLALALGGHAAG